MNKQIYSAIAVSIVLLLMSSIFNSCIQEILAKATVETSQVTSVTEATAICGGVISADGGSDVSARGVCWNTSPYPTIENITTAEVVGTGPFTSLIKGLSPSTTYYIRAYATNKGGTSYGLQMSFTTKILSIATTPIAISLITATSAIGGGNIISDGDSSSLTVTVRGVCWNTFPSPTIENRKTSDGIGGGRFTSKMDSLTAFTTYYARAYATNGNGTIYGNEVSFTTLSGVIVLTTNVVSSINAYSVTGGGMISSDGGASVTASGICWSTTEYPTTADSKTTGSTTSGSFISSVTGLSPGLTYYVRAYATNSFGTAYGNQVSFTTLGRVVDIVDNVYNTITLGTQTWMVENLKTTKYNDGTPIHLVSGSADWADSTPGYCWYNNDAPNNNIYGALYNWYTVNTKKLAPTGWHVPTGAEWTTLENYLIANGHNYDGSTTENKIAKSIAATAGWSTSTTIGSIGNDLTKNNTSGLAGLPGGYRNSDGAFSGVGYGGGWWSSTEDSPGDAWARYLSYYYSYVYSYNANKQCGFSVRCVRDN